MRPRWAGRLALALALLLPALAPARAETVEIRQALSAAGDGATFPGTAPALSVALPDEWAVTRPGSAGPVWYRLGLPPGGARDADRGDGSDALMALLVPRVCSNLEVRVDGRLVHSGGRMAEPLTNNCNHPQLVNLPAALLRSEGSTVDIKVAGHALGEMGSRERAGRLSAVMFGPQAELAARHARLTLLQVGAPQAVSATLLLMGGFMFVLGFVNRRESHLAYFGAASVGWALIDARLWLRDLPVPNATAEILIAATLGFVAWAAVQFLLRHAGLRHGLVDRALPLQFVLLPLTLVAAGPQRLHTAAGAWYLLLAVEVVAAAAWHLRHRRRSRAGAVMAVLLTAAAATGAIEFAAQWTGVRPLARQVVQLVVPVLFVLTGLRLVQQQGHALHRAEEDRTLLEQRVREATAEIERNFRQLSELRVEQVTERERKRIAADLHDDLGAKLLTIVHTSESDRISTLAREALEEMRLSVRGLTGKPVRLADALGDWRAEVFSRLAQAGIEATWEAPEELPQMLSARAFVQTTRILREATSNIIKHSRARHCSVIVTIADGDFQLVVQDDGDGISNEIDARLDRGHGLASMKNRAKQLHGQCLVESGPGYGTVIRLTLPLDGAIHAP